MQSSRTRRFLSPPARGPSVPFFVRRIRDRIPSAISGASKLCGSALPYIRRAVADASDDEARGAMLLASSYAGMGFGNAGVHLPHGMSYPVAGLIRDWRAPGYNSDHAIVPHGISVILNAPAVFRFTARANPQRSLRAAQVLGASIETAGLEDAGRILSDQLISLMRDLQVPNGLGELGYSNADIPALVEGTLPQHRVTKLSPRPGWS